MNDVANKCEFLAAQTADHEANWSLGTFGAIAEFAPTSLALNLSPNPYAVRMCTISRPAMCSNSSPQRCGDRPDADPSSETG